MSPITPRSPEFEIDMKTKQIFFNAATVCMVAAAVMMTQAMFNGSVNAEQRNDGAGGDLRQRVADLEDRQDENDVEFVLVDRTLADLNARINANDADIRAQARSGRAVSESIGRLEKRAKTLEAQQRSLAEMVKRMSLRQ